MTIMLAKEVPVSSADLLIANAHGDQVDCFKLFKADVQRMEPRLLTAEEEVILGQQRDAGIVAQTVLDAYGEGIALEDRMALSEKVEEGGHARETFFFCNQGLSIDTAKTLTGRGVSFAELIQDGDVGLMEAIDRWEWQRGKRFSTYATYWIVREMHTAINLGKTIRIKHAGWKELKPYLQTVKTLTVDDVLPSDAIVAKTLGVSLKKIYWYKLILNNDPISYDELLNSDDNNGKTVGETFVDPTPSVYRQVAQHDQSERTRRAVDSLPANLRSVLMMRFGLADGKTWTQDQVGDHFEKTKQWVSQREAQGIRQLRWYNALHHQELYPDAQFAKKAQMLRQAFYDSKEEFQRVIQQELDGMDVENMESDLLQDRVLLQKYFSYTGLSSSNYIAGMLAEEAGVPIENMVAQLRKAFQNIFFVDSYAQLQERLTDEQRGKPAWFPSARYYK